ncbi:prepilin-type N-terminal cleavage/methylation domain-containing protein [Anatilimnocola floriformis]|uniref:prepilin-type N-terminal cleavage/methylation domain-containing protein n=1 Tax=Anatilimnocola floriformis TaxID=2948575 RepID=UPI0020C4FCCF|nr:prepilin-type N-terminal cleavage/methylation domain-containing protein [Anatilimnocola floriformis]
MLKSWNVRRRRESGFTLLELIIVLVVLVALAALVVPLLGWVRKQAEYATGAAGAAEAMNNLEIFRSSTGRYPDRFDSLVTTTGTLYLTTSTGASVWPSSEIPLSTIANVATASDMTILNYYLTNDGALTSFVNHNLTASSTYSGPNTSTEGSTVYTVGGTITPAVTAVAASDGPDGLPGTSDDVAAVTGVPAVLQNVAIVKNVTTTSTTGTLARLIRAAYPNQANATIPVIPTGRYLVAVGIGGRNSAVGTTMSSPPQYSGAAAGKYGRFIAFFDVGPGATGRGQVQLKCVTDPTFTTIAQTTDRYKGSGPTE